MIIYCVNSKEYFADKEKAIKNAKRVLKNRQYPNTNLDYDFFIRETEKGISVRLNAPWEVVGNSHLLMVVIKKIQVN